MNDYEEVESDHWIDDKFTNVRTGEKFSISDFEGKQVLVETFAVLCPACKRQQLEIKKLHDEIGDKVVLCEKKPKLDQYNKILGDLVD